MSTPEGRVKDKVRKGLGTLPKPFYRFMPVQNGMGAPGLDFYGCYCSMFIAIETKVEGKKLTARQKETARQIKEAGGIVFVIRTQQDVDEMLGRLARYPNLLPGMVYDTCP